MCWTGRAREVCRGVSSPHGGGRRRAESRADVPDDDGRSAGVSGLASRRGGHARRHGIDWGVLEADWNLFEGRFTLLLVNARHVKQVPGRKTDVSDAEWVAQLLQHGLLRSSFVLPTPIRELRDLTRLRPTLVDEKTAVINRIQKVLEDANVKLGAVPSDVVGVSGRAMLQAIVAGESDPQALAELAKRRLRSKMPALRQTTASA